MLFEQSFMALPEFLLGTPYKNYDHEGTLVMAFSMAILQELNGRNVNNPISCLRGEAIYPDAPTRRADIHLDLEAMNVLSPDLQRYGLKKDNWLEAKFWRTNDQGKPTYDKLKVTMYLLGDLIRLSTLPPEPTAGASTSSRYLLHVYKSHPNNHIAKKKNSKNGVPGFTRSWVTRLHEAGEQKLEHFKLPQEVGQFDSIIGDQVRNIELQLVVTNFAYVPRDGTATDYWLYLSRLDEVRVEHNGDFYEIKGTQLTESKVGAFNEIQKFVVDNLSA